MYKIEIRVFSAVLWRIFDRKIIVIGSLWLESRTIVGYRPYS